jgi:hypothetical protein
MLEVKLLHTTLEDYAQEIQELFHQGWELSGEIQVCVDKYGDLKWVVQRLTR